jgi:hypothetical protein
LHSHTILLEALTLAAFIVSPLGVVVRGLFAGLFTLPSEQPFTVLVYGWAGASGARQPITTSLWLTGATSVNPFRAFIGC